MADVKWIKIATDIFDDEKILLIESLPAHDSIITIWFKLLCLAGKQNNSGVFIMNNRIAYTDEMLATIFRRDKETVRLALKAFEEYGMIERIEGVITIPNWDKHQQLDALEKKKEYDRERAAKKREESRKKLKSYDNPTTNPTTVVSLDKNKNRLERDKDIEEDKSSNVILSDSEAESNTNIDSKLEIQAIFTIWSEAQNLIKHRELTPDMEKAIKKSLKTFKCEDIVEAIKHYDIILGSRWYFNYKWSMVDFLTRKNGLPEFMEEGSKWCSFKEELKKNPYLVEQPKQETEEVPEFFKDFLGQIK